MNCYIDKTEAVLKNGMKSEAMERDVILKIEDLSIFYGEKLAVDQINLEILKKSGDRYHRAIRLREKHFTQGDQSDE